MITVEWDNANSLEMGVLLEMAKDGYNFVVCDGRIRQVEVMIQSFS